MLSRKKLGFGIIGLVALAVIYYVSTGSTRITEEMKKQLNTELASLQTHGFSVTQRETKERDEHFLLSFNEPAKVAQFLQTKGIQLNRDDAQLLKGFKLGVDLHYLPDTYSAFSFEIYPVALPDTVTSSSLNVQEKKMLAELKKMLERKTFLMHVAVNKLGRGFKGHIKDINEILHGEQDLKLSMKGFDFSGDIKEEKIHAITQNLKHLTVEIPNEIEMQLYGLKSEHLVTGKSPYDYTTNYRIEKMEIEEESKFTLWVDHISVALISVEKEGLTSTSLSNKTETISFAAKGKKFTFDTLMLDMKTNNLNVKAFEALQQTTLNNTQKMTTFLQKLISKGISIEIPTLSIENIISQNNKMGGFTLNANVNIDKSLNLQALQTNPMTAVNAIDTTLNISLSKALFSEIAQQPKATLAMMLFPPKDSNGTKRYELEVKHGKIKVNGTALF